MTLLDLFCQHTQRQRFSMGDGLLPGGAVFHCAGYFHDFGNPSPIGLLFGLNGKAHVCLHAIDE
ncbi:hypothetical protein U5801_23900 [Lamprobacter modestohalophilus]|uniref:hypothetical protein n=1 Tax=Lamprobacter modestohalophilus TaxID=1064514 RepID=UPI002ADECD4E|nr:hypothetical protein [Lamprobacter modestohalophilus]MEA1052829.1 hypothetical protein [Lamprobacter modestohalophilus]